VTWLDVAIIGFTLLMAAWGYAQGLIVGAMSLGGFVAGAFLGSRVGPLVLQGGAHSPFAPMFALLGALLLGGLLATIFELVGSRVRERMGERLGVLDGLGGGALVACLALAIVWIVGAVALHTPGTSQVRPDLRNSRILQTLNAILPPSGPILNALARFDPFPTIAGPAPEVSPPNSRIARDPQVRAAGRSVVRVIGTACGLGIQGSGWVAGPNLVVTNAHVVAGESDTNVELRNGSRAPARAIWYDEHNDLALLRTSGVSGLPALRLDPSAQPGTSAAILGYPENGPFTVRAGRLGDTRTVMTEDSYGRGPIERRVTSLRGRVRSGNSGGPMVDGDGRVVTTIFAAAAAGGNTGYGVPATITRQALARAHRPVSTGPCGR
jgi:S1-C subfamily serine protease